eukprot:CAMPEP_0197851478 /NCGR_PEP_ID=MMETSP1438-20131217/18201_1 /TAXON_ID=1461541 /ORGANISM="Pterosperma sp., Strain CCMP1384" /LENGTH=41 /DNA_ID= /DNA_START= /DNA_END= /DNA_ORIENTATION=
MGCPTAVFSSDNGSIAPYAYKKGILTIMESEGLRRWQNFTW